MRKWFIGPILENAIYTCSTVDFVAEYIFNVPTRHLDFYVVKRSFIMPGDWRYLANATLRTGGAREMVQGDVLLVRLDETMPDRIDVEPVKRKGKELDVFSLNRFEFNSIQKKIEKVVPQCMHSTLKPSVPKDVPKPATTPCTPTRPLLPVLEFGEKIDLGPFTPWFSDT